MLPPVGRGGGGGGGGGARQSLAEGCLEDILNLNMPFYDECKSIKAGTIFVGRLGGLYLVYLVHTQTPRGLVFGDRVHSPKGFVCNL